MKSAVVDKVTEKTEKKHLVQLSTSLSKRFVQAIENSGMSLGDIASEYFDVTYQTLMNVASRKSKSIREKTMNDLNAFVEKFAKEHNIQTNKETVSKAQIHHMSYQFVKVDVLIEKMSVIKSIVNSNLDSDTKLCVIKELVTR